MKNGAAWLIVDTETDGLMDPIHVVEVAAQRMMGWEPVGEKFRVLLNHNVHIPSAAVAIHGYTEEFLRKNGEEPLRAHAMFRDFAEPKSLHFIEAGDHFFAGALDDLEEAVFRAAGG